MQKRIKEERSGHAEEKWVESEIWQEKGLQRRWWEVKHWSTCRMAFSLDYFWHIILPTMFPLQHLSFKHTLIQTQFLQKLGENSGENWSLVQIYTVTQIHMGTSVIAESLQHSRMWRLCKRSRPPFRNHYWTRSDKIKDIPQRELMLQIISTWDAIRSWLKPTNDYMMSGYNWSLLSGLFLCGEGYTSH